MATKKEYRAALDRILATYYNLDNSISAGKKFNEDMKLLYGLVNDHFEEKSETNYEHFKDEIIENSGFCFALANGKPCQCSDIRCTECGFSTGYGCSEKIKEWLNKPYEKPKYKFTQFEYDLINTYRHVDDRCKFNGCYQLKSLKEKGYFKYVDKNELIKDILENCEVIKND